MKTGKALLGVLAALAAGSVLGMIFAPYKTSNSRKKMSKIGEELADAVNKRVDERFGEPARLIASKKVKSENDSLFSTEGEGGIVNAGKF